VARHLKEETLLKQIAIHTRGRDLMIFGDPRVNVFELNMVLDTLLEYDDK
jgi:K+-transporting ATPase c subunit